MITKEEVGRVRRRMLHYDDSDATLDEQGFGHPDRNVDFTIRPISAEWRLADRTAAFRTARANVQYIWRDGDGRDRFGTMPKWFGERTYDLRAAGLLLPRSAPVWASTGYELWDRIDAATAATGDPTAVSAWHVLAELPRGLDPCWWEWLAVSFAQANLVQLGAPVAYAVHALAADEGGWAISPHVHMVVAGRRFRSGPRHGERMITWAGSQAMHHRLERAWRTTCGHARVTGATGAPFTGEAITRSDEDVFRQLSRALKCDSAYRSP